MPRLRYQLVVAVAAAQTKFMPLSHPSKIYKRHTHTRNTFERQGGTITGDFWRLGAAVWSKAVSRNVDRRYYRALPRCCPRMRYLLSHRVGDRRIALSGVATSGDCQFCFGFFSGFSGFLVSETIKPRNLKTTNLNLNLY